MSTSPTRFEIAPSPARRWFAVGAFYLLGGLTVWIAASARGGLSGTLALVLIGLVALAAGEALRRSSLRRIVLDERGLSDSAGARLADWGDIERVERGAFALKPSNGFVLLCRERGPRGWVPGLWWRFGRRVGVGGVLPGHATRAMADAIAVRLAGGPGPGAD